MEKTLPPEMLLEAIRTVSKGDVFFSPFCQKEKQECLAQPEVFQKIVRDREQEVSRRVVSGCNDERFAGQYS